MTDVLVTRVARDAHVRLESAGLACEDGKCFELHRVRWAESLLSEDGRREICRFVAPDAESVRMALRKLDGEISSVWAGTTYDAGSAAHPNIVIERDLASPLPADPATALAMLRAESLDAHGVELATAMISLDRLHVVCAGEAPSAEAARLAREHGRDRHTRIWRCRRVIPS